MLVEVHSGTLLAVVVVQRVEGKVGLLVVDKLYLLLVVDMLYLPFVVGRLHPQQVGRAAPLVGMEQPVWIQCSQIVQELKQYLIK